MKSFLKFYIDILNKISEYFQNFLKRIRLIRKEVRGVKTGKFIAYLIVLFFLPGGSVLCIIALYIRYLKND
jgi:hypothetical protein|tara:strand:+ start:1624 stop:1836 length:213 start_codon:yes stop_codon:yes gene_type:complete